MAEFNSFATGTVFGSDDGHYAMARFDVAPKRDSDLSFYKDDLVDFAKQVSALRYDDAWVTRNYSDNPKLMRLNDNIVFDDGVGPNFHDTEIWYKSPEQFFGIIGCLPSNGTKRLTLAHPKHNPPTFANSDDIGHRLTTRYGWGNGMEADKCDISIEEGFVYLFSNNIWHCKATNPEPDRSIYFILHPNNGD
jgi:hypothetical protein